MRKLTPPTTIDHKDQWSKIVEKKQEPTRSQLLGFKPTVESRFDEYISLFSEELLVNLGDSRFPKGQKDLMSCYLSGGKWLNDLKKRIFDLQSEIDKTVCMYCRIKQIESFDHYFPKEEYPEFSALGLNLVPCCTTCNGKKKQYLKEGGIRGIINFYLDSLPQTQFLFCNISFRNADYSSPLVRFSIENRTAIPSRLYSTIEYHFERLNLLTRYQDMIPSELSELKLTLDSFGRNLDASRRAFEAVSKGSALSNLFGPNYWRAVFYNALGSELDFFQNTL